MPGKHTNKPAETEPRQAVDREWYVHAFEELYPILYAHRTVDAAKPEAAFAMEVLNITGDESVLDLCCGGGRHMAHLAKGVRRVTGLDYSNELLAMARKLLGSGAALVRADMRFIPFTEAFDAIVNFFTSFGYFFDEADNRRVVAGIAGSLRPRGRFFIDYVNREYAVHNVVPQSTRSVGQYEVHDERWIDADEARLNKRTSIMCNGAAFDEITESVRLYDVNAFAKLLETGGLAVDYLYGDYSGVAISPSTPRMIAVGHKA